MGSVTRGRSVAALSLKVFLCVLLMLLATSSLVYASGFVGPSTITIDGTFTDWGTTGSPISGVYTVQDASNTGEQDGTGFAGKQGDIGYYWSAISTSSGGEVPAGPSNLIQNFYYRIDTLSSKSNADQVYAIQMNLGAADPCYADHLLHMKWDNGLSDLIIVLYEYDAPYPEIRAFTTGDITGRVSNVSIPYSGFSGVVDGNAHGKFGKYDGTNYGIEVNIPVSWYGSAYGGAVQADGSGASYIIASPVYTITGGLGSVGSVKDTLNDGSGNTLASITDDVTGDTDFVTDDISQLVFTTDAQTITAGQASTIMTVQTQDGIFVPQNVSGDTTLNLVSTSGTGRFDTSPSGDFNGSITSVTIASGTNSASFSYKDTTAGTPTITASENPSQDWTDASQQETITAGTITKIVFTTSPQSITAGEVSEIMNIQTQDTWGNPSSVGGNTTIDLVSTSGTGRFDTSPSGDFDGSITSVTIASGTNSASFYYKDNTVGTPTITASENPSQGWTDGCQQQTVTASTADITNTPNNYNFGIIDASSTTVTGLTYFTLTNNSSFAVNISISGTDMAGTGDAWVLADTAVPGTNIFGLMAGLEGGDYTIIVKKNSPFNMLVSNLVASGTQKWGLKLLAPTDFSDGGQKSGTVTLTATQS